MYWSLLEKRTEEVISDLKPGRQRPHSEDEEKILLINEREPNTVSDEFAFFDLQLP